MGDRKIFFDNIDKIRVLKGLPGSAAWHIAQKMCAFYCTEHSGETLKEKRVPYWLPRFLSLLAIVQKNANRHCQADLLTSELN